jgi:oxygen-independent coproporphyrinogen-3 oxidase
MSVSPGASSGSLYIHVPFCAHKCAYCAFYSEAAAGELLNRYVAALGGEMELIAGHCRPRTVFFGGGTPSLLNLRQWQRVLDTMERLNLLGAEEWTIECNPATVSLDKAKLWRDYGVNRLSLGVQSLDETLLDRLGRVHNRAMVFKSFDLLRRAGFDNLNLDLMFAIPGQTLEVWRATLDETLALGSEHLSCYEVIYEEDTPLFTQLQAGQFSVDEDLACAMYDELLQRSARSGFEQYEVANFARRLVDGVRPSSGAEVCDRQTGSEPFDALAQVEVAAPEDERTPPNNQRTSLDLQAPFDSADLPARACRHNVNYWRGGGYYGLGPSAVSYVGGVRAKNWSNSVLYCEQLEQGRRAIEWCEELPPLRRAGETAAFGLRMNVGWPFGQFERTTGFDLRREWRGEIEKAITRGWGAADETRFHLTPTGLRFADTVAEDFLR